MMDYDNKVADLWIENRKEMEFFHPCYRYRAVLAGDAELVPKFYTNDLEKLRKACRHAQRLTTFKGMVRYLKNNTDDMDCC